MTWQGPPLAKLDDLQEDEGDNDADVDMSILDMSVLDETLPDADAAVGTQRRRISVARRLQGCHHTVVTLSLHRCYTAVKLLSHCCFTVVALLLHCCYTVRC
jgi:hypothetical protein